MCRPWRAFALGDGQHGHHRWAITEWNRAGVYLYRYETMVGKSPAHDRSSATYFDHNHRESKNVCFLAVCSLVQDFWCSPPRGVTMLTRSTPRGIQISCDCSEAKIRETRMTGVVHKDVRLSRCQCGADLRLRTATYPLEVPVDDIAGVEIAEALSDVR